MASEAKRRSQCFAICAGVRLAFFLGLSLMNIFLPEGVDMFPNLRSLMTFRHVRVFELAHVLKISDGATSNRLNGRIPWAPHERNRLVSFFGVEEDWLFQEFRPPVARRETASLVPAMETR